MAQITAAMVKELREKTGAGMMDCKTALSETDGDMEAAVDWLRTKGLAAAAKKSGRVAAEGLVGISASGQAGAIVEVNSETDFVARNEDFQSFVRTVADLALANDGDLDTVLACGYPDSDRTVAEELTNLIATIGENITIRRMAALSVNQGAVAHYMHNKVADGLGKIGVLVALDSAADAAGLAQLGKELSMHVAAANPQALDVGDLDPALIERERQVLIEQARDSGKPDDIIEKMIEGRLRKYYEQVVLLQQTSVIDGESKIAKLLEARGKELGGETKVAGFVRFALGEGVEKKEDDFAAEVKAAAGI